MSKVYSLHMIALKAGESGTEDVIYTDYMEV